MTLYKLSKENHEWVAAHPRIAVAIANLRGQAGMSEDAIYHSLKHQLNPEVAPSIRDIRAAFMKFNVGHETVGGARFHRINAETEEVVAFNAPKGLTHYRDRYNRQLTEAERVRLNRTTSMGYLIHTTPKRRAADTPETFNARIEEWAEQLADPEAFLAWEDSQAYDATPPF